MEYRFIETMPQLLYDSFVTRHPHCHLLQSSSWAQVKSRWRHYLTGLEDEAGNLVAAGLILIRVTALGQIFWYLPKGPVLDYTDHELRDAYLKGLARFARKKRASFVRIDPPIIRRLLTAEAQPEPDVEQQLIGIEKLGFIHQGFSGQTGATIQPRYHMINHYEANFLDQLPAQTKRMIKLAEEYAVTVDRFDRAALSDFSDLLRRSDDKDSLLLRGQAYLDKIWDAYGEAVYLYLAEIDIPQVLARLMQEKAELERQNDDLSVPISSIDQQIEILNRRLLSDGRRQLLAGTLAVEYGTHLEILYSGSDQDWDKVPAQYAIYAKLMSKAFDRGIRTISIGGVPGSLDESLAIYRTGFEPQLVETIGEFDLPIKRMMYRGMKTALRLRKKLTRH